MQSRKPIAKEFKKEVKETDYAERIYGEDCFPTTMISESGIDKIYNCYDR